MRRVCLCLMVGLAPAAGCAEMALRPGDGARPAFDAGYRAYQSGRWQEAEGRLTEYLASGPSASHAAEAHYWRGLARLRLNRRAEALSDFGAASLPGSPPEIQSLAYVAMGNVYYEEGADRQAIAAYTSALRHPPRELALDRVYLRLAISLERIGEWVAADGHLRTILQRYPGTPSALEAQRRYRAGGFSVQTGAYASAATADREAGLLRQAGFEPHVAGVLHEQRPLHAVRVGKVRTYQEARALAHRVHQAGFTAMVVP